MTTYTLGTTARLRGTFKDNSNTVADPAAVFLRLLPPSGAIGVYEFGEDALVVRESTGVYSADILLNQEGRWRYRWEGTGSNEAAAEGVLDVEMSEFA